MDLQNGYHHLLTRYFSLFQKQKCLILKTLRILSISLKIQKWKNERSLYWWMLQVYINIPHEEGIATVCRAYDEFHRNNPPIPTKYLREMQWKWLPSNLWYCHGHENGCCSCKHFLWLILKHKFSVKVSQNQQLGNATLTIFSHCGILVNLI